MHMLFACSTRFGNTAVYFVTYIGDAKEAVTIASSLSMSA